MAPPNNSTKTTMRRTGSTSAVIRASTWRREMRRQRAVRVSVSDIGGLLVAVGEGEEHVVEGRGVDGEAGDVVAERVHPVEDRAHVGGAAVRGHRHASADGGNGGGAGAQRPPPPRPR